MFRKKDQDGPTREPAPSAAPVVTPPVPSRSQAPTPAPAARPTADASAGKRLIVGEGLSLAGDITACDLLIVEGSVQVTLNDTRAIEIAESGRFTNGKASVEEATISGIYQGELTVRGRLLVRGTGRVEGTIRYGELEVERGGRLAGSIEILSAPAAAAAKPAPVTAPATTPANAAPAKQPAKTA